MRNAMIAMCAVLSLAAAAATADELKGVWVASSGSVDTSSPEAVVKCLVKPEMTDEAKALAVFNWYRRVIYPHNYMGEDRRDVLRQINSYGCTLCGSHAANMGWLMRTAGFKTRCVYIYGGGHTFIEVWFDGGWHALDPETDFAVWSRATTTAPGATQKPHLISMDELKADPTLLDNAEKEGRAKPWFFKAMKFPFATRKKMADYCDTHGQPKMEMQWSSCVIKGMTIKDYFIEGVKTVKYSAENEANGGRVSDPNLMKLTLRPGEKIVRTWDNEGKGSFIAGQGFGGYPAHFMAAGEADESDCEVFPWVEPYRKDNYGLPGLSINRCYRYSGNGHVLWSPKSAAELIASEGVKSENVKAAADGGVVAGENGGTITVPVRSSYALVGGLFRMTWADLGKPGRVVVVAGKAQKEVPTTQQSTEQPGTMFKATREINGQFNHQIRIELPAGTGLRNAEFDHTFANNRLALPYLVPGKNTIRVRLDNPDALKTLKLLVRYEWAEGPDWKTDKSDEREVTAAPFDYDLEVAGPKFPRMKSITLEAAGR